jgi:VWFA-related protein
MNRLLSTLTCAVVFLTAWAGATVAQESVIEERVSAARLLLDVRVVDRRGRPVTDLGPEDFTVEIGKRPATLEAADWVVGSLPAIEAVSRAFRDESWHPDRGRLILILIQRDLDKSRIRGLMKMRRAVEEFIGELREDDRIALAVHDVNLKIYADFTGDHDHVARLLGSSVIEQQPPPALSPGSSPSLVAAISSEQATDSVHVEDSLLLIGKALRAVPGRKTLVFLGWGMNRWNGATETLGQAIGYLVDGRTTIFSLDVTDADYHTLEFPLIQAASESGGVYIKTNVFSRQAMTRVENAIEGYYELSAIKPELKSGRHPIVVRLREGKANVYYRQYHDER